MRKLNYFMGIITLSLVLSACGNVNQSVVEGTLVDVNGEPVAGVTIMAEQLEPLAGYERKEATTDRDGSFRIRGLYPSSEYVVAPDPDSWLPFAPVTIFEQKTPTVSVIVIQSAPLGETRVILDPLVIEQAYSLEYPLFIADIATGEIARAHVEGIVVDADENPVSGVTVHASPWDPPAYNIMPGTQLQRRRTETIEEQFPDHLDFETVTDSDGTFQLSELFADVNYELTFQSDAWSTNTTAQVRASDLHAATKTLSEPVMIEQAFSAENPSLPANIQTGEVAEVRVEGMLLDGDEEPIAGVRIVAIPQQLGRQRLSSEEGEELAERGGERFSTLTQSDGSFILPRLWANARYRLEPRSDTWSTDTFVAFGAPSTHGEVFQLPNPLILHRAFSKDTGVLLTNIETGETPYTVSQAGVIFDSETGLEWLVGPDETMNHEDALQWADQCNIDGGGWRLPTQEELDSVFNGAYEGTHRAPFFPHDSVWSGDILSSRNAASITFSRGRYNSDRISRSNHVYVVR